MTTTMTRRGLVASASALGGASIAIGVATIGAGDQSLAQTETGMADLSFDTLFDTSASATSMSGEAADRVAIRTLIDAWGHYADRRMADAQAALLVEDGVVTIYDGEPDGRDPVGVRNGRAELREALDVLNRYTHTTHLNGQSALSVRGDRAIGETYCMAHHLYDDEGQRKLLLMAIRYYDEFVRVDEAWRFASRILVIDWSETRPSPA